jgi:hypothetical protein
MKDAQKTTSNATNALTVQRPGDTRLLTAEEFQRLATVPPEAEWFPAISPCLNALCRGHER